MTLSPQQLKDRLLKTIDNQYNVTDKVGATELLSVLERYPVTREILEKTRIGLYVNEMRKKTTDKDFAKRIKNLVRKWQLLCKPSTQTAEAVSTETVARVNGKGPISSRILEGHPHLKGIGGIRPDSPASRPETPCSIRSSVSSPRSTFGTPTLAASTVRRDGTEVSPGASVSRSSSEIPLLPQSSLVSNPLAHQTYVVSQHRPLPTKLHSAPTTPMSTSDLAGAGHGQGSSGNGTDYVTSGKRKREDESSYLPGIKIKIRKKNSTVEGDLQSDDRLSVVKLDTWSCTPETTQKPSVNGLLGVHSDHHQVLRSSLENAILQDVVSSKPRRGRPPNSAKAKAGLDRTSSMVSTHSAASSSKMDLMASNRPDLTSLPGCTPKVETTAEIIQKLHASGELRLVASDTVKNIVSNRIVKETHSDSESVVPAAAKPRPRKKNSVAMPPTTPDTMTMYQIKNEMVHKFLETSVQLAPPACDSNALNFLKHLDPPPEPEALIDPGESTVAEKPPLTVAHSPSRAVTNEAVNNALEAPLSLLPPFDPMQIDWNSLEYEAPDPSSRPPVTDDDVEQLHRLQLPGINGQYDYDNKWVDWTSTYSVQSYNGELLHILPYVNITD